MVLDYAPIRKSRFPRPWIAIFITAILFASIHDWWEMPSIFVLAIALGYVYERTGNLWACITLHALFNCTEIALFLMLPHMG